MRLRTAFCCRLVCSALVCAVQLHLFSNRLRYANRTKQASGYLRAAAGVFDYIRSVLHPKWPFPPSEGERSSFICILCFVFFLFVAYAAMLLSLRRPQDCVPAVADAMSYICVAQAQQLAVRRAALNPKMGRGMLQ